MLMLSNDDPKDPKETRRKGFLSKKTRTLKVSTGAAAAYRRQLNIGFNSKQAYLSRESLANFKAHKVSHEI